MSHPAHPITSVTPPAGGRRDMAGFDVPSAAVFYGPRPRLIAVTADDTTTPLIHLGWDSGGVYVSVEQAEMLACELHAAARRLTADERGATSRRRSGTE